MFVTTMLPFLLPVALALAISPVAVAAVVRMAGDAPSATRPHGGFLAGWWVGVLAVTFASAFVVWLLTAWMPPLAHDLAARLVRLVLAVLLAVVALRRWRARPRVGERARWPGWVATVESADPARAAGLGFALAALDLKNLLLGATAGAALGLAEASFGATVLAGLVFAVLSGAVILGVVLAFRTAREKVAARFDRLVEGLELNLGGVEPAVMLVVGAMLLGRVLAF